MPSPAPNIHHTSSREIGSFCQASVDSMLVLGSDHNEARKEREPLHPFTPLEGEIP
jgi:hypothetical protein